MQWWFEPFELVLVVISHYGALKLLTNRMTILRQLFKDKTLCFVHLKWDPSSLTLHISHLFTEFDSPQWRTLIF